MGKATASFQPGLDLSALRLILTALAGWWSDQRQAAVAYLIEENRIL